MKVRIELDVELSDEMRLGELEGLAVMLEERRDVVSAFLRRAIILEPHSTGDDHE